MDGAVRLHLTIIALLAASACSASTAEKVFVVPTALQGCWTLNDPIIPDYKEELTISASGMSTSADWIQPNPTKLTIRNVERSSDTTLTGMIEYRETSGNMATYATEIGIGIRGAPADRLVVVEGDAGSRWFTRCPEVGTSK